jgi:hypothetical protein
MGAKLSDVERPRLGDHIFRHPLIPSMHAVDPSDNLPRPMTAVSMTDTLAPPLTVETFVCMGDERVFVIRDEWGEITLRVSPDKVRYSRTQGVYMAHFSAEEMSAWLGNGQRAQDLVVEPLRPQCGHYKRVMTPFENELDVKHVERVCTAQRGESGEFVSLNDTQVFACEHRTPRDFVSEERLRRFDAARLAEAEKADEEWDPEAAVTRSLKGTGEKHG